MFCVTEHGRPEWRPFPDFFRKNEKGGVGSIRGAFVAGIFLGVADTLMRAFLPGLLRQVMTGPEADALGVGIASTGIYFLMVIVLLFRPKGLFAVGS